MTSYFFLVGNTPQLSQAEIAAVYPDWQLSVLHPHILEVKTPQAIDEVAVMGRLGGTVKILIDLGVVTATSEEALLDQIVDEFVAEAERDKVKKLPFAIAEHGRDHLPAIELSDLKNKLSAAGLNPRYRDNPRTGLSASVLLHHPATQEMHVIQTSTGIRLGRTVAVQNIDEWSLRDRQKPYADRKKGMLPPKVSRMMVNLGVGNYDFTQGKPLVYDPFCGTGTIPAEALMIGCTVAASDSDPDAVTGSRKNLEWLQKEYQLTQQVTLIAAAVTDVRANELPQPVQFLITEPFLGKQTPNQTQLPNIFKGLEKLYWGAFRHWTHLLADQAVIVMVFPIVTTAKPSFTWEQFIDKLRPLGYTMMSEPIVYHRPQAVIQRQIYQLRFTKGT